MNPKLASVDADAIVARPHVQFQAGQPRPRSGRFGLLPAWAPTCVPLIVGVAVMLAGRAPVARWGLHMASGVLGVLGYFAVARTPRLSPGALVATAFAVVALIASTALGSGIDGVYRWHEVIGLRIHPSALLSPPLIVLAAAWIDARPLLAQLVLGGVQIVHVQQPDAGQASAFGAAAIVLVLASRWSRRRRITMAVVYAASVAAAWMRPDSLAPAPFVEDAVERAFALGSLWGVTALASLLVFVLAPFAASRRVGMRALDGVTAASIALAAYFAASLAVVVFGEFPVPLLGFAPSPAIGAFLGLGALRRTVPRDRR